jgi:hypothetical protein
MKPKFDLNKVIPAKTSALFRIKLKDYPRVTKIVFHKYGEVDFKNLSIEHAERLVNLGAEFISRRVVKPKK